VALLCLPFFTIMYGTYLVHEGTKYLLALKIIWIKSHEVSKMCN